MRNKKPEIQTLQYLDWFNVKNYLCEKYEDTNIQKACYQVFAAAEVRNDSYLSIRTDIEDYYFEEGDKSKELIALFCELFNKEFPNFEDVFYISW